MPQFMIVYKGEATDMSEMTQEETADVMAKWAAWMEGVGPALRDIGTPFGPGGLPRGRWDGRHAGFPQRILHSRSRQFRRGAAARRRASVSRRGQG